MNTEKLTYFTYLLFVTITTSAQTTYQFGALPAINLNEKLKNDWSINYKVESRQLFKKGIVGGLSNDRFTYAFTDFLVIASKKVGLNSRISGGYFIRFPDRKHIHRSIQQFAVTQRKNSFRLTHRFVTDQTFSTASPTIFRFRYRLTPEIPLNGQSADVNEFYLKINNEYVNSLQNSSYDLEIRLAPLLGYTVSKNHKIEAGLDYRINSFLHKNTRNSYWMSLNWYVDI